MKRSKKHRPIHPSVPMLVNRMVNETVETLAEHNVIVAFRFKVAQKEHYDYLVRMANMLNIAYQCKPSDEAHHIYNHLDALAKAIFERYGRVGKFGVLGDELTLMRKLVLAYDAYWKRQTTTLYNHCAYELNAFYAELAQEKADV